jgi:16S rRNA (guanine527-N7)-methyltransferase
LPGIPIAIARPDLTVHLIEARARRTAFLELAVERLALHNARVAPARAEEAGVVVDVAMARAFAGSEKSWRVASDLVAAGGSLLYWAGRSWGPASEREMQRMGVAVEVCSPASTAEQGPVVKMTRTVLDPEPQAR